MDSMNDLPVSHPARNIFATLVSSPNQYIEYPALGTVVVHEFDIHGSPLLLGFKQYTTNGEFGPIVRLGVASLCTWNEGFHDGARVALAFEHKERIRKETRNRAIVERGF